MIRQATLFDAVKISKLWGELVEETPLDYSGSIEEQEKFFLHLLPRIRKEDSLILVAEEDGEIVGFSTIDYRFFQYGTDESFGLCDNIYINKEYRGKDLMRPMIDWMTNYGKGLEVREVQFETVYDSALIKVWERKGFKPMQVKYRKEVK